jgi:tight adherence protein B
VSAAGLGVVAAALAACGAYLIYTSAVFGWRGFGLRHAYGRRSSSLPALTWLRQMGGGEVGLAELAAAMTVLFVAGSLAAFALFGGPLPAVVAGCLAACVPVSVYRARRQRRLAAAAEAWPRMLEELRLATGSQGRSIPQALFEVGRRGPEEWRPAFAAAEREWQLTTDFDRTTALLKDRLADPSVDVVCETLVIAQEVGGSELESRLGDLIEDRLLDLQARKDAASRQAGVRFARRFVLLVPLGMALAGLSIGTGRHAYDTPGGQVAVAVGLLAVVACWIWSGRLMRLPEQPRVFR